jgi:hypothetical protein
MYKAGTNWKHASLEEARHLICSLDLDGDDLPVTETTPGEFIFTKDIVIRFYKITSDDSIDKDDFVKLECLRDMRMTSPDELRYWFHDVPEGKHIFETYWSDPDFNGERYLMFKETYSDQ